MPGALCCLRVLPSVVSGLNFECVNSWRRGFFNDFKMRVLKTLSVNVEMFLNTKIYLMGIILKVIN